MSIEVSVRPSPQQKFCNWDNLCKLKWYHTAADEIFYASQYLRSWSHFLPDNPLCKCLPKPSVSGTLPVIPRRALTSFFPFCSMSLTWISYRHRDEFSPFSFILSRSDKRNTCGIHPLEKKKSSFTFLFFSSFVPPFHPYLAKVKEIFAGTPLSRLLLPAVVSCLKPNCHAGIESMDILGRSITAFMLLQTSTLPSV